jgi:hypothetical protein
LLKFAKSLSLSFDGTSFFTNHLLVLCARGCFEIDRRLEVHPVFLKNLVLHESLDSPKLVGLLFKLIKDIPVTLMHFLNVDRGSEIMADNTTLALGHMLGAAQIECQGHGGHNIASQLDCPLGTKVVLLVSNILKFPNAHTRFQLARLKLIRVVKTRWLSVGRGAGRLLANIDGVVDVTRALVAARICQSKTRKLSALLTGTQEEHVMTELGVLADLDTILGPTISVMQSREPGSALYVTEQLEQTKKCFMALSAGDLSSLRFTRRIAARYSEKNVFGHARRCLEPMIAYFYNHLDEETGSNATTFRMFKFCSLLSHSTIEHSYDDAGTAPSLEHVGSLVKGSVFEAKVVGNEGEVRDTFAQEYTAYCAAVQATPGDSTPEWKVIETQQEAFPLLYWILPSILVLVASSADAEGLFSRLSNSLKKTQSKVLPDVYSGILHAQVNGGLRRVYEEVRPQDGIEQVPSGSSEPSPSHASGPIDRFVEKTPEKTPEKTSRKRPPAAGNQRTVTGMWRLEKRARLSSTPINESNDAPNTGVPHDVASSLAASVAQVARPMNELQTEVFVALGGPSSIGEGSLESVKPGELFDDVAMQTCLYRGLACQ